MRRTIFIISALAGALGAAPAFAQSDDLVGDEEYPADDYAAPAEEYAAGDDYAGDEYTSDDTGSYDGTASYDDTVSYDDTASYDNSSYAGPAVSTERFRRALAPYGRWVRTPEYGLIWIPSRSVVGSDFVPYASGGNWRYSNAGWTFVSDWSWGWAPFHYGRWYRAPRLGWIWMPGSVWGPAWVDWRFGNGYVGWAPLPPRRFAYALRHHNNWFFCTAGNWGRPRVHRYRVRSTPYLFRAAALARRPVHHGRARWFAGPNPRAVERATRTRVPRVNIRPRQQQRVVRQPDRRNQIRVQRQQQRVEQRQQQRVEQRQQQRVERQQQRVQQRQQAREQRVQQRQQQRVDRPRAREHRRRDDR